MNKVLGLIGLAMRAGALDLGEAKAEDKLKAGRSKLLIIARDASFNTKKKFKNMCDYRNVKLIELFDRYTLGNNTGRDYTVIISVSDDGFAKQLIKLSRTIDVEETN